MKFKYKAIKEDGTVYEDIVEVSNKEAFFRLSREKGDKIISVDDTEDKESFSLSVYIDGLFNGVKTDQKIIFARSMGNMIEAGLSVSRSLSIISKQTKDKNFKNVIEQLNQSVGKGSSLSAAMDAFPNIFSPLFVHMTQAGEEGGNLSNSLKVVADQIENSYLLVKKIKGALIYPAIVLTAMFLVGVLMLIYVVPPITATFEELKVELPQTTQFFIFLSNFFVNNYILLIFFLIVLSFGVNFFLKTSKGEKFSSFLVLHLPIVSGIAKEANSAWVSRTLASLLVAGVGVVKAFEVTKGVIGNVYYKEVMEKAEKSIQKGLPLSAVFEEREDIFPPLVTEMIRVGEETGRLPDMLEKVADFYEKDVGQKTKDISTIVEPLLMIVVGIFVGFFAFALITPMYSLMSGV